jgi:hypothetical protein
LDDEGRFMEEEERIAKRVAGEDRDYGARRGRCRREGRGVSEQVC